MVTLGCAKGSEPTVCTQPTWTSVVTSSCTATQPYCVFNGGDACGYGVGISVLTFILTLALILYDYLELEARLHQNLAQIHIALDSFVMLLWFIGWCWMADAWRKEPHDEWPVRVVS